MKIIQSIQNRIYEIRGERVMLDKDLATLYGTETKVLNLSVRRNIKRFPEDFMFQLTAAEFDTLKNRIQEIDSNEQNVKAQIEKIEGRGGTRYLPYAFTEHGIAMLSGVLSSDRAINMNIAIMRAFIAIRRIVFKQRDLELQVREIKDRLGEHDVQLSHIYDAMENILDEKQVKGNGMIAKE